MPNELEMLEADMKVTDAREQLIAFVAVAGICVSGMCLAAYLVP